MESNPSNSSGEKPVSAERRKPRQFLKDVVVRPKQPNAGIRRDVDLVTNLTEIKFDKELNDVVQYAISFQPEVEDGNTALIKKIMRSLSKELHEANYGPYYLAGVSLFSAGKNREQEKTFKTVVTVGETEKKDVEYTVKLKQTNYIIDLVNVNTDSKENLQVKQFIEGVTKNIFAAVPGLLKFDRETYLDYGGKHFEKQRNSYCFPGFTSGAMITQGGLLFKLADKNRYFSGQTAYEKIEAIRRSNENGEVRKALLDYFANPAYPVSVITKYGRNRVIKISDISFEKNVINTQISVKKSGEGKELEQITLKEYYKRQYGITIKDEKQFLLVVKPKNPSLDVSYLVPELVELCGLEVEETPENQKQRAQLALAGQKSPDQKLAILNDIKKYLTSTKREKRIDKKTKKEVDLASPNDIRAGWGINYGDLATVKGRVLPPPIIQFNREKGTIGNNGKYRQLQCKDPVAFDCGSYIAICPRFLSNDAESCMRSMERACGNLGIKFRKERPYTFNGRYEKEVIADLDGIFKGIKDFDRKRIVLCILDKSTQHLYPAIKQFLYSQKGIVSQMMVYERNSKNKSSLSYFANILVQMVAKCKGTIAQIQLNKTMYDNRSMIIGFDSRRMPRNEIQLILTLSYDRFHGKYYTITRVCATQSKIDTLTAMLRQALEYFNNKNKGYPENIIIYRNGGNDTQKLRIYNEELPAFIKIFESDDSPVVKQLKKKAKFCFIAVNKKTEIRFFAFDGRDKRRHENPRFGTCVDTKVVSPYYYEFYIQSQSAFKGSAAPSHYHCLYDTTGFSLEDLEEMTNYQAYYYWNWCGCIKEPACLKYSSTCITFFSRVLKGAEPLDCLYDCPYYI